MASFPDFVLNDFLSRPFTARLSPPSVSHAPFRPQTLFFRLGRGGEEREMAEQEFRTLPERPGLLLSIPSWVRGRSHTDSHFPKKGAKNKLQKVEGKKGSLRKKGHCIARLSKRRRLEILRGTKGRAEETD